MQYEIIGNFAGALVASALIPQVIKTYKTKSVKDISLIWTTTFIIGLSLWITYAALNDIMPLGIFGSIELTLASTLFAMKLIYRNKK